MKPGDTNNQLVHVLQELSAKPVLNGYLTKSNTHTCSPNHYIPPSSIFQGCDRTFLSLVQQPLGEQWPIKLGGSGSHSTPRWLLELPHTLFPCTLHTLARSREFPSTSVPLLDLSCANINMWPPAPAADRLGFPRHTVLLATWGEEPNILVKALSWLHDCVVNLVLNQPFKSKHRWGEEQRGDECRVWCVIC